MLQHDPRNDLLSVRLTNREKWLVRELARIEEVDLSTLIRLWVRVAGEQYGLLIPPIDLTDRRREVQQ